MRLVALERPDGDGEEKGFACCGWCVKREPWIREWPGAAAAGAKACVV